VRLVHDTVLILVWIDVDNHHTASRNGLDWTAGMAGPERPGTAPHAFYTCSADKDIRPQPELPNKGLPEHRNSLLED
jgi:hypothetical protein